MAEKLAVQTNYTINANPEKVWDLIGRAIFDSLGNMGRIKVLDENTFTAELKLKVLGLIPITMKLRGEMVDNNPYESLGVKLSAKGAGNLLNMVQRVTFATRPDGEAQTAVECKSYVDGLNPLFGWAGMVQVRSEASKIFKNIQDRLNQWV